MSRTLIFGGTFNPVHVGHLRAGIEVAEVLGFGRVDWVPSFAPLHKLDQPLLRFDLRVALLRAALRGHDRFHVNEVERELPVPSITFQTLEAMARSAPAADRYFLLGDREFLRLPKWRFGNAVVNLTHIVIACRTEFDLEAFASAVADTWPGSRRVQPPRDALMAFELLPGRCAVVMALPRIDVSSSLVRRRWLEGRSLSHLVPDGAIEVLELHREEVDAAWRAAPASALRARCRRRSRSSSAGLRDKGHAKSRFIERESNSAMTDDLRDTIFASVADRLYAADVRVTTAGVICGVERATQKAKDLGCEILYAAADGDDVGIEAPILSMRGPAKAIAMAEDCVPGAIAKPSGISRAMRRAQQLAGNRVRVVSGAAKKMPEEVKDQIRRAVHRGGGSGRISEAPFLYLDKNYVRIFGSVRRTLEAVAPMQGYVRAIQLRGLVEDITAEARSAIALGAEILMVDSGRLEDLDLVARLVRDAGRRDRTTIAFAGDIAMDDIPGVTTHDVDILDIGRAILDAPIVDIKFDVRTG